MKATRSLFIAYFLAVVFSDSGGSYNITWLRQQRRLPPPSRGKFFLCFFDIMCLPCLNLVTERKTNSPVCDHLSYSFTYMNYYGPLGLSREKLICVFFCDCFHVPDSQNRRSRKKYWLH